MIRSSIFSFINDILIVFLMALFFLVIILSIMRLFESSQVEVEVAHQFTPVIPQKTYNDIDGPIFALRKDFLSKQLPDLRSVFTYYGQNERPDVDPAKKTYTIAINEGNILMPVFAMDPVYLLENDEKYSFSPNNKPTDLWIKLESKQNAAEIYAYVKDSKGDVITQPSVLSQFALEEQDIKKVDQGVWYIGKFVVDKNLLKNQQANWYGKDVFLQQHGGEEYVLTKDKDRIDFGTPPNVYSIFVQTGDKVIWEENRWHMVAPGESTIQYPLMFVKSISDKAMELQVWDITGRRVVNLSLPKSRAPLLLATDVTKSFKFIGYKTWSEFIIEVDGKRRTVSTGDWLLREQKKPWELLNTPEEIKSYVDRNLQGTLFIIDKVLKKDGKLTLFGHLFDASRTKEREVELPQVASPIKNTPPPSRKVSQMKNRQPEKKLQEMTKKPRRRLPMFRRAPGNR